MQEPSINEIAKALVDEHIARMSRSHKSNFRDFVVEYSKTLGYEAKVDDCFLAKNVIVGDLKKAKIVLTAHYDTPPNLPFNFVKKQAVGLGVGSLALAGLGLIFTDLALKNGSPQMIESAMNVAKGIAAIPTLAMAGSTGLALYSMGLLGGENKNNYDDNTSGVLTLITLMNYYKSLPPEQRDEIAFVFFDNEEKGLFGSLCHRVKHLKKCKNQQFLNFDCVGVGKNVNVFHTGNEKSPLIENITEGFCETISRAGYTFNVKKSTINSVSDHYSFVGTGGNVTILCDDIGDDITNHIHSKKDNTLDLDRISGISEMTAVAIDNMMGYKGLDRGVFSFSGKLCAEK